MKSEHYIRCVECGKTIHIEWIYDPKSLDPPNPYCPLCDGELICVTCKSSPEECNCQNLDQKYEDDLAE